MELARKLRAEIGVKAMKDTWLVCCSILLSLLVGALIVNQRSLETEVQILHQQALDDARLVDSLYEDIKHLEGTLSTIEMDQHSMVMQCELTLDLLVAAGRGGWWTKRVLGTLAHIQKVKQERKSGS